jgi:hypothetical protein
MLERLNPRERVLLGAMALIAVGMVCFLVVLLSNRSMSAIREEVDEQDMLLKQLRSSAPQLREQLEKTQQPSTASKAEAPPLGSQLQAHATKAGMGETDLEISPQPEEEVGAWTRKSVEVRLRRKPLGELANLWALTVNDRARYPVAITRLTITRRRSQEDEYDVEMTVSSYHPSKTPPDEENTKAGGSKSKSKRSKSR